MFRKIEKALRILCAQDPLWRRALCLGVGASVEHLPVLERLGRMRTIVDIGANRGQFALVARHVWPEARIHSFEPLPGPAALAERIFRKDGTFHLHRVAISTRHEAVGMHVSARDDSSSLLPIGKAQTRLFPGTEEVGTVEVRTTPLDRLLTVGDIESPALLKLDVQGFELEALKGCDSLISRFTHIYAECSFVQLYEGQALADEVIAHLNERDFRLAGMCNPLSDSAGRIVQADFLFEARRVSNGARS